MSHVKHTPWGQTEDDDEYEDDYTFEEILWDRRFVDIYSENPDGTYTADYGRIHDTEFFPASA